MTTRIKISLQDIILEGELLDTPCGQSVARILPIEAVPNQWGDEFYFPVPLDLPPDSTSTISVNIGDIGYWPPGKVLAIFFGPTPMSSGERPVPASEVNIAGRITGDATVLRKVKKPGMLRVERI
ncbi:MAG TPA: cyclophilin-like fold protein [Methanoregulaceae archaeon]|nr:cyclophilin-like fold protein [Methanoregulaceae archaeon]